MSENDEKLMNRWLVVVGAILIQLALGAIYAWSVFSKPLVDDPYNWTKTQTQIVFSVGLVTFAVVMVLAGQVLLPKLGPRNLSILGGVVLGLGYILAGVVPINPVNTTIFVGLIGGAGIGLAYVIPIGVGMKWFPDKKGLITGLAVAGFGFGATIWVKLAGSWGKLIDNLGVSTTFLIYGIIFLIMVVIGGFFMVNPPEGYRPEGWTPEKEAAAAAASNELSEEHALGPKEMLKTTQYYLILITFIFSAMSGLMTIGLAKLYPISALQANGYSEAEASAIAGTAMAIFYSIFNGLGRITWGKISDVIGVKKSVMLMTLIQGITMIVFTVMAGNPATLYLGMTIIGFNFGGNFALFPTFTAATFGKKHVSANYAWVFLAYGIAGIVGPILGGMMGDKGLFTTAFIISGVLTLVSTGIAYLVKPISVEKE